MAEWLNARANHHGYVPPPNDRFPIGECRVHYYMMTLIAKLNNIMFGPLSSRPLVCPCVMAVGNSTTWWSSIDSTTSSPKSTTKEREQQMRILCVLRVIDHRPVPVHTTQHSGASARFGMALSSLSLRTWRHMLVCASTEDDGEEEAARKNHSEWRTKGLVLANMNWLFSVDIFG